MSKWWQNITKALPARRKDIIKLSETVRQLGQAVNRGNQELFLTELLKSQRYSDPQRLARFEHQVYSQNGEDGILAEIFRRIGVSTRYFVEIGVGDGLENNTVYLLSRGWAGIWMEGSSKSAAVIRRNLNRLIGSKKLTLIESFITRENVSSLLEQAGVPADIDLLSIDIDRNTFYIWEALADYKPRVVVVEYNAIMPPELDWKVQYRADQWYDGSLYFGASLKAFEILGGRLGYSLVGCDLCGVNAFFVRNDLTGNHFTAPFSAENHYEPPRYWLIRTAGHPRGFGEFSA
jgi:hypothetical protein